MNGWLRFLLKDHSVLFLTNGSYHDFIKYFKMFYVVECDRNANEFMYISRILHSRNHRHWLVWLGILKSGSGSVKPLSSPK